MDVLPVFFIQRETRRATFACLRWQQGLILLAAIGGIVLSVGAADKAEPPAVSLGEGGELVYQTDERGNRTDQAPAVAVIGKPGSGINDRLMLRPGDNTDQPVTLAADGESFTFADHAYIRILKDRVDVSGDLRAMNLRVEGHPRLFINGKQQKVSIKRDRLSCGVTP